jgi:hypothetical protein
MQEIKVDKKHILLDVELTRGCRRLLPIGYLYGFGVSMEKAVNHNINPDNKSSRESKVEAIIAREPLLTEA